jgi:hypothetical protein
MFPSSHSDIVLLSLIKIVEKIIDASLPPNLIYNFGYAMIVDIWLRDGAKKRKYY